RRPRRNHTPRSRLVPRIRRLQAGRHPRGHPLPLSHRIHRGRRIRQYRRARRATGRERTAGALMDFAPDARTTTITAQVRAFLDEEVLPAEPVLDEQLTATPDDWSFR